MPKVNLYRLSHYLKITSVFEEDCWSLQRICWSLWKKWVKVWTELYWPCSLQMKTWIQGECPSCSGWAAGGLGRCIRSMNNCLLPLVESHWLNWKLCARKNEGGGANSCGRLKKKSGSELWWIRLIPWCLYRNTSSSPSTPHNLTSFCLKQTTFRFTERRERRGKGRQTESRLDKTEERMKREELIRFNWLLPAGFMQKYTAKTF